MNHNKSRFKTTASYRKINNCNHFVIIIFIYLLTNSSILGQTVGNEFKLSPIPSWIKPYPIPKLDKKYDSGLVHVQSEIQINQNTKETFCKDIYYVNTINGLNQFRTFTCFYRPLYQTCNINKVNIYRKNKIIKLDSQLHIESNINVKHIGDNIYDENAQLLIFLDVAQVGDMVEIAQTIKGEQPDLEGHLFQSFHPQGINTDRIEKSYIRLIASIAKPFHFNTLNIQIKPIIEHFNGLTSIEFISTNKGNIIPKTPSWYNNKSQIYVSDMNSWKEVIDLYIKNYELDNLPSEMIRNKVFELTSKKPGLQEKINAIFNFIQKDIYFLNYDLIDPKKPDVTIQGFGDCKSKSLLTIKMLECLGVNAWPVIVKITGLDERLITSYNGQIFDHCVVEFKINRDTILFDPTMPQQRGNIYQKYVQNFKFGLRLIKNNAVLSKLRENITQKSYFITTYSNFNNDNQCLVDWQLKFEGNIANVNNNLFESNETDALFNRIAFQLSKDPEYYYQKSKKIDYFIDSIKPISLLNIKIYPFVMIFEDSSRGKFLPRPLSEWIKVINSYELGPYFSLPDFKETSQLFKFESTKWMNVHPDSTIFENDWIRYHKKIWKTNDTIYALYNIKILKDDLDSARYKGVVKDIELLKKDMEINFGISGDLKERFFKKNLPLTIFLSITIILLGLLLFTIWRLIKNKKKHNLVLKVLETEIFNMKSEINNSNNAN